MLHSRTHGRKGKRPVFWIPSSFHPEDTFPPNLLCHSQSAYYLMHLIVRKTLHSYENVAVLRMEYLRKELGRNVCKQLVDYLVKTGDITRKEFKKGRHAFVYAVGEKHSIHALRKFYPTDVRVIERERINNLNRLMKGADNMQRIHECWEEWQFSLGIDLDLAYELLETVPQESNPYGSQEVIINMIDSGDRRFIVDDFGRVHNLITSLCRQLRPALRMDGEPLLGVDIVNAQPAFLSMMITQDLLVAKKQGLEPTIPWREHPSLLRQVDDGFDTIQPIDINHSMCGIGQGDGGIGSSDRNNILRDGYPIGSLEGFSEYHNLTANGKLYEHLMTETGLTRDKVKDGLLRDVFGKRGRYPSKVEDAFRKCFPGVWKYIRKINQGDHGNLLRGLQIVEAFLVICLTGTQLRNGGPFVSLHDSVYCKPGDVDTVKNALSTQAAKVGIEMKLKTEIAADLTAA